jgi:hypothetical protein
MSSLKIQSGRVECHKTIQKALSERGGSLDDEEVAADVSYTIITEKKSNNSNDDHNKRDDDYNKNEESCFPHHLSWKQTIAQANGKLWGGGAGGIGFFPFEQ